MKVILFDSLSRLDLLVWILVMFFFCGSALLFHGNVQMAFIGSGGVIFEMLLIGLSIEIIIESLKNTKGIGTLTGFITNGPEAICLLVGLLVGDIIFASSTPLGSNFMNPVLLICAGLICGQLGVVFRTNKRFTVITITTTAAMALIFYTLKEDQYLYWLITALAITLVLFFVRPAEPALEPEQEEQSPPKTWLIPAILILCVAGYFLDPVVSFAAQHSHAPKGVIGFIVLATLTSWPEFKSALALLRRQKPLAAILNITVSNITNIWLAAAGVSVYLFSN